MWPYVIGVLSAAVLAGIVFKAVFALKASARRKKEHSIEMVKVSTIFRLERRYTREYDDPYFSRQLAQAVANKVFAGEPCDPMEVQFAKYNAGAIENRLRALQTDTELMRVLSLSAHVESNLSEGRGPGVEHSLQPLHQLEKLGLLDSSTKALDADEFERVAKDFCDANGATSKIRG